MEGQGTHPAMPAAAVSVVLDDDDLLREIILRLAFPTDLVRAAAVCRRWLRVASAPAFLRRYRALHPPRVLGLFAKHAGGSLFEPLPHPRGLAAAAKGAMLGSIGGGEPLPVYDCRNGRVLMDLSDPFDRGDGTLAVVSPLLHASRSLAVLPPVPLAARPPPVSAMGDDDTLLGRATDVCILLPEDGGDGQSYTVVTLVRSKRVDWRVWWEFFAKVSVLRAGAWDDDVRATAPVELPARCRGDTTWNRALLVQGKLYVLGMQSHAILVLDLASMATSFINLPDGVRHEEDGDLDLFRSNDAGVNLIHVNGFQARLWRRGGDDDDGDGMTAGNWVLVDDIGVRRGFDHLAKVGGEMDIGGPVGVIKVGDDCEFMFLCVDGDVLYMDIRRRMVKKIFKASPKRGGVLPVIHPLTMVWPPIFPVLE